MKMPLFPFLFALALLSGYTYLPQSSFFGSSPRVAHAQDTIGLGALIAEAEAQVDNREFPAAQVLLDSATAICRSQLGEDCAQMADILHQRARIENFEYRADAALAMNQRALDIRRKLFGDNSLPALMSYENMGINHYYASRHLDALGYFRRVEAIALALGGEEGESELPNAYNLLGIVYSELEMRDSAVWCSQRSLDLWLRKWGEDHALVGVAYNNLGIRYDQQGDYERSISCKLKALTIIQKAKDSKKEDVPTTMMNIGVSYYNKADYDAGITWLTSALDTFKQLYGMIDRRVLTAHNNLAGCYDGKGAHVRAIQIKKTALGIARELYKGAHVQVAMLCNNLGYSYLAAGQPDSALHYLRQSLDIHRQLPDFHASTSPPYRNMGMSLLAQGKYAQAAVYLDSAMAVAASIQQHDPAVLAKLHEDKADLAYAVYQAQGNKALLTEAIGHADEAFGIYHSKLEKVSEGTKWGLAAVLSKLGDRLIGWRCEMVALTGQRAYYQEAYHIAERSRSMLLLQSMRESKARRFAGMPPFLLDEERSLGTKIRLAENRIRAWQQKNNLKDSPELLALRAELFELTERLRETRQAMMSQSGSFANLIAPSILTADAAAAVLSGNEALLEYFVGERTVYAFVIRPDTFAVLEIPRDFDLENLVAQLREGLYRYHTTESPPDNLYSQMAGQYAQAATALYERLVAPVQPLLRKDLYIVPDGVLGYIPFEALLMPHDMAKPIDFHSHRYLGREHAISYSYSATLLKEMAEKQHQLTPKESLLALAPFHQRGEGIFVEAVRPDGLALGLRSDTLTALPHSGEEARRVAEQRGGKALVGAAATKAAFEQQAAGYRVLHLSTHGVADDRVGDYSWLGFAKPGAPREFEKLYVRDIYNLSLNADLVVLSACQAGLGKLERGEGIISLSRAFAYAGAKGMLTTLWSMKDDKAKDFMVAFYEQLLEMPAAEALWKTRDVLLSNSKGEQAHPYYWAGFIAIGAVR